MTPDVPKLPAHLSYRLRQFSNYVAEAFSQKVEAKGVTAAEWAMMRVLHDTQPVAPSLLADTMGMTRGAISKLADRLIAKPSFRGRRALPMDEGKLCG